MRQREVECRAKKSSEQEETALWWCLSMEMEMEDASFEPDLINAIFKMVWSRSRRALERERNVAAGGDAMDCDAGGAGPSTTVTSKKNRPTSANANAVKLSCQLVRVFVTEAVQRAAAIAEAEGVSKIEATHLERILPQLLLDF